MDEFIETNKINKIDYLHCDAQGSDLDVLKSFGKYLQILVKGKVEGCVTNNLYKNENNVKTLINFLESNNFQIINVNDINGMINFNNINKDIKENWNDADIHFINKKFKSII